MSKIYKGYKLIKAIVDGEIKEGQQFNIYENGKLYFDTPVYYRNEVLRHNGTLLTEFLTLRNILNLDFELIEDEEIDIDNIEELLKIEEYEVDKTDTVINRNKINELVRAVKQLDKRTRKEKE